MKFNRTTISLSILALGLTGFVYVTEIKNQGFNISSNIEKKEIKEKIFPFKSDDIKTITIEVQGEKIIFQKKDNENKPWRMIQPEKLIPSDGAISFLINLFNQAENKVKIINSSEKIQEYGLDKSQSKILLTLNNGDKYQIILGKSNFDNSQIYAQVDFPPSVKATQNIFLVSKSFQYAIERDFAQWKDN